jgi:hypothetical protein
MTASSESVGVAPADRVQPAGESSLLSHPDGDVDEVRPGRRTLRPSSSFELEVQPPVCFIKPGERRLKIGQASSGGFGVKFVEDVI